MKIAVAAMGNSVAGHFGHCENFIFFDTEDGKDVYKRQQNGGARETFTVRKNSNGIGVEKTWPVHSPFVDNIEVVRRGKAVSYTHLDVYKRQVWNGEQQFFWTGNFIIPGNCVLS